MTNILKNTNLPAFSTIHAEDVEAALDDVLKQARQTVNEILSNNEQPSWQSLVLPMEALDAAIDKVWSPVSHLNSVMNSDELRLAYNAC